MNTKTIKLYNPTKENIIDYPIGEAVINPQTGDAEIDFSTGEPRWTGNTYEWSIKPEETLEFPAYVARHLAKVYAFLKVVGEGEMVSEPTVSLSGAGSSGPSSSATRSFNLSVVARKTDSGKLGCPECGAVVSNAHTLKMHMIKHIKVSAV